MTVDLRKKVAQIEAAQPRWISVEERLPEENGKYTKFFMKQSIRELMGNDFRQEFPWEVQ